MRGAVGNFLGVERGDGRDERGFARDDLRGAPPPCGGRAPLGGLPCVGVDGRDEEGLAGDDAKLADDL